ncbi:MAG: hypothetical protein ACTS10_09225 [Kiloniellales bacterium]
MSESDPVTGRREGLFARLGSDRTIGPAAPLGAAPFAPAAVSQSADASVKHLAILARQEPSFRGD